jgi:O-antigen ligase
MVIKNKSLYHKLLFVASTLLLLFPAAQISGPFLPDFFIILISIIFLFVHNYNHKFILFKNRFFLIFIIFYIYLIIGSLLSDNIMLSVKSSLFYIRFLFFSLAVFFIFRNNKNYLKYFYIALFFTLIILIFDGYYQFFTGKNIFGFAKVRPDRLGGLFFEQLILGSYISKILPIFFTFVIINKDLFNKKYILLFSVLSYVLIFLSGERAAFLLFTLYLMLIAPFFLNLRRFLVVALAVFILLSVLIFSNKNLKNRYVDQMLMHTIKKTTESNIFMPDHIGLFTAAIDIFKKNIFFGSGVKTFRVECIHAEQNANIIKLKEEMPNISFCSTHPHNYYFQLLAETGLVGFSFIFFIFLKLCLDYFKQMRRHYFNKKINKAYICILVGMIQTIWPLTTTGSFFNNWVCSTIFLTVGIYLFVFSNEAKNKL